MSLTMSSVIRSGAGLPGIRAVVMMKSASLAWVWISSLSLRWDSSASSVA